MMLNLAAHVHLAIVDGDLVFLDVRHDSYLCLPARDGAGVLCDLKGETATPSDVSQDLLAAGLLLTQSPGKGWQPIGRLPPHHQYYLAASDSGPPSAWVPPFGLIASAGRTYCFRMRALRHWVSHRARNRLPGSAPSMSVEEATRRFDLMRPFFPRTGRCLPRSMLLSEFLRKNGFATDVVFGVRVHPFEAHCWVEHDGYVLGDSIEHIAWYTVIASF